MTNRNGTNPLQPAAATATATITSPSAALRSSIEQSLAEWKEAVSSPCSAHTRNETKDNEQETDTVDVGAVRASWYDPAVGFKERLVTFQDPAMYFCKPTEISPLVCARFGWSNTSKDILACTTTTATATNPCQAGCGAVLSIQFHPKLNPTSTAKLTQTYRTMLATGHQLTCPRRTDASHWLPTSVNDINTGGASDFTTAAGCSKGLEHGTKAREQVVEPFMLSVLPQLSMFHGPTKNVQDKDGFNVDVAHKRVVRNWVRSAALKLDEGLPQNKRLHAPMSAQLEQVFQGDVAERIRMVLNEAVMQDDQLCLSPGHDDDGNKDTNKDDDENNEEGTMDSTTVPKTSRLVVNKESAFLAAFGWTSNTTTTISSSMSDITPLVEENVKVVECHICQARALCPYLPCEDTETTIESDATARDTACTPTGLTRKKTEMDLVKSHRHYCPYATGFPLDCAKSSNEKEKGTVLDNVDRIQQEAEAGWKIILFALLGNTSDDDAADLQDEEAKSGHKELEQAILRESDGVSKRKNQAWNQDALEKRQPFRGGDSGGGSAKRTRFGKEVYHQVKTALELGSL